MQIPPITNHQYGHFATMGINETAVHQATGDAGSQGSGYVGEQRFQNRGRVDWIMLLTGCALVYFSGKILFNQFTRGVNGLEMPLWTASVEMQAKHLLFAIQFSQHEQDQLRKDFEVVRQTNPFVNFFEWVRSQRSEFCSGRKYSPDYVLNVLVSSLRSNESTQLANLARTLQQSMRRQTGDSLQRVDDFVEQLQSTGLLFQAMRGTGPTNAFAPSYQPAPGFIPPVGHTQGGAEQSDLSSALEVKSGVAHSSTPFDDAK
ncbi:putative mitochondrial hypothetical protein [Leptomonas pyrrhocoris]|uniref:Uncharacterized protein n=1 Tax=Leptomonas pyrrhocoris TaxID=157538 RepID=A0A0N1J4L8_LEPPY|nr:putative mitochondrial hypothetical protein [Leptomonas pyrrhocoris]XP_015656641.1 putative mitochondrial hypothetical protein [Leptomonas pyrrhocoris]KPA78201.1 putative mitochondrial hypothetical protein [Leptomonas pyrrhocoris]KPA78202.1 putative mitochondrial hypothetical protein [Leptomonas pyrrhocoris]|eukprot:XP_015656640.1 putative mitochondrial hypothetical protein [Leptomonas pyrrhocoris]